MKFLVQITCGRTSLAQAELLNLVVHAWPLGLGVGRYVEDASNLVELLGGALELRRGRPVWLLPGAAAWARLLAGLGGRARFALDPRHTFVG